MPTTPLALPDSEIATAALAFTRDRVPDVVYHHSVRSYLYARELARQNGLLPGRDYDDELVFLGTVLHDLGLTDVEESPERFEVHGADQAVAFARGAGLDAGTLPVLWDAVALHTSNGIAHRKQPEVALTQLGISADIIGGPLRERLPADLVAAVHERHPRLDLGPALTDLIVEQARRRPEKAGPLTFPGHLLDLHGPVGRARTRFDVLARTGWDDRREGAFAAAGAERPEDLAAEFSRRLARRDVDGLLALYDADAVFVPEPGAVARGHEQVRAALAAMVDAGGTVELDLQGIHVAGDQALIANRATLHVPGSGPRTTVTTEVARRRADGRWVYLVDDPFFAAAPADAPAGRVG